MAYNTELAERIRDLLGFDPGISERKMFGGLCFMHHGNMLCGVIKEDIMVRVGPKQYENCLTKPGAREMDFTGKPLKGMVYVNREQIEQNDELFQWLQTGLDFVTTLPAKK